MQLLTARRMKQSGVIESVTQTSFGRHDEHFGDLLHIAKSSIVMQSSATVICLDLSNGGSDAESRDLKNNAGP